MAAFVRVIFEPRLAEAESHSQGRRRTAKISVRIQLTSLSNLQSQHCGREESAVRSLVTIDKKGSAEYFLKVLC